MTHLFCSILFSNIRNISQFTTCWMPVRWEELNQNPLENREGVVFCLHCLPASQTYGRQCTYRICEKRRAYGHLWDSRWAKKSPCSTVKNVTETARSDAGGLGRCESAELECTVEHGFGSQCGLLWESFSLVLLQAMLFILLHCIHYTFFFLFWGRVLLCSASGLELA